MKKLVKNIKKKGEKAKMANKRRGEILPFYPSLSAFSALFTL